jgi:hypothetical protein
MRTIAAVFVLLCAGISCAQERKAKEIDPTPQAGEKKRLESVTWDLKTHKLVWVVAKGKMQGSDFIVTGSDRYEISPDEAVMQVADEKRGFATQEAVSLHKLLDTLSVYCAESVVWWDEGQGIKLDPKGAPEPKREKVEHKKKQRRPNPEELVAGLQSAIVRTLE